MQGKHIGVPIETKMVTTQGYIYVNKVREVFMWKETNLMKSYSTSLKKLTPM